MVKRWWFEANAWSDPQAQREFLSRIDSYRGKGPPSAEQRMSREEIRTQFGVRRMYRWELDGPAQQEFADLPPAASIPSGIHGRGRDCGSGAVPAPPSRSRSWCTRLMISCLWSRSSGSAASNVRLQVALSPGAGVRWVG
jgi:hypothetical protein